MAEREINKTLFRKIRDKILRVPESYDQSDFGYPAETPCGTCACLAGHALIESGFCTASELNERRKRNPASGAVEYFSPFDEAQRLLGLEVDEAGTLFSTDDDWPLPFEDAFMEANTNPEKARVAADYINHIIKTGSVY